MTKPAPHPKSSCPSKARRAWFALGAIVIGVVFTLICFEAALRVFNPNGVKQRASWHFLLWEGIRPSANPEKAWEHIPGYTRRLIGYSVKINSLGFRGEEIAAQKNLETLRVLALGDSMTFGMSGGQEDCYPAQLQSMLRQKVPSRPVEVVNAGVLGYTTLQEEALLRECLPKLHPDIVILWWFRNDVALSGAVNSAPQSEQLKSLLGYKPRSFARDLIHLGYEVFPCTAALARAASVGRGDADPAALRIDPATNPEGWSANSASLRRIMEFCKSNNTPIIIYSFGRYEAVASICREGNVPYITTVQTDGIAEEKPYAVSPVDGHFDREGNRIVASTLMPVIQDVLQLPKDSPK